MAAALTDIFMGCLGSLLATLIITVSIGVFASSAPFRKTIHSYGFAGYFAAFIAFITISLSVYNDLQFLNKNSGYTTNKTFVEFEVDGEAPLATSYGNIHATPLITPVYNTDSTSLEPLAYILFVKFKKPIKEPLSKVTYGMGDVKINFFTQWYEEDWGIAYFETNKKKGKFRIDFNAKASL